MRELINLTTVEAGKAGSPGVDLDAELVARAREQVAPGGLGGTASVSGFGVRFHKV